MVTKVSYGKILVAVFITILIWVWADLALDEELPDKPAVILVDESANPKLWVSFQRASSADIRVTLSGPHSIIAEENRKLKKGKRLEFDFDAAQEKMNEPATYTLTLLPFLQKDKEIRRSGLKVQSCEPDTLSVSVVGLAQKSLAVECIDEGQNPIKDAAIKPANVVCFVPADWSGEKLVARVQLTRREIDQARLAPVEKTPYIELAPGQFRKVPAVVKVSTPPQEDRLSDYTITTATLGFSLSANLQGKYTVEVTNLDTVMSAITIRATPDAKRAYEKMRYQVILEIDDSDKDVKSTEPLRKELIYNFPAEYVRRDEIMLNQQPIVARFKLTPLSAG